jgi:hypothetical protein
MPGIGAIRSFRLIGLYQAPRLADGTKQACRQARDQMRRSVEELFQTMNEPNGAFAEVQHEESGCRAAIDAAGPDVSR